MSVTKVERTRINAYMKFRFRTFVNRYQRQVYSLALHILGNTAEAEDATQEVYERLWRHMDSVEDDAKAKPWLLQVTRNLCIDKLRQRKPHEALLPELVEAPPGERPEEYLEACHISAWLRRAIDQLHEPYRSLVTLMDMQQKSVREVAQQLDMSETQVKVYTHRARKRLRQYLQGKAL